MLLCINHIRISTADLKNDIYNYDYNSLHIPFYYCELKFTTDNSSLKCIGCHFIVFFFFGKVETVS